MSMKQNIFRPKYHFALKRGWINDPNGIVWFQGKYHLYFQCNPYSNNWDKMHWGHAVSHDLIHWEECNPVLIPEEEYEDYIKGGCFSGSVVVNEDKIYAFYTAVSSVEGEVCQRQCMAYSFDGYNFIKYEKNPIIESIGKDFRDPKVIFHDGTWQMVVGGSDKNASDLESHGRIYLFHSKNLFDWSYSGILYEAKAGEGTMFECPDIFEIGGKWVITASPMNRTDFLPTVYMVGNINFKNCIFFHEYSGTLDFGPHYYASQTYKDKYGQNISMAWLGGWEWMPWINDHGPAEEGGYRGIMSYPRLIDMEENILKMLPYSHDLDLKSDVEYSQKTKGNDKNISNILDKMCERIYISGVITRDKNSSELKFEFFDSEEKKIIIKLDFLFGNIITDFTEADDNIRSGIRIYKANIQKEYDIDFSIIKDGNVLEVYLLGGKYNFTSMIYPYEGKVGIGIRSKDAIIRYRKINIEG